MEFRSYRDVPEIKDYLLDDVVSTGRHLGTGSFGSVVEMTVGGTMCAGKKIHVALLDPQAEGMQKMVERFVSECKLISKVRHPNIVQFMGLCFLEDSTHPMLVMERLDTNLDSILEKKNNLPFPLVIHILLDITKGLVYLHSLKPQPIIHRDLTARNILLYLASMQAKIADLGNAMMIDEMRLSKTLSQAPGTTPYMPPEALQAEAKYNTMLDVFSFGHLALFAVLEEFPGDLLAITYSDPLTDELKARSEVERREAYIRKLFTKLTKEHPITQLILQCLHNVPAKRPTTRYLMERIDTVHGELDDTENSLELVGQTEVNSNTQEEQMLDIVQEDPEPITEDPEPIVAETVQVEDDSNTAGARNQMGDSMTTTAAAAMDVPVQRIEALKKVAMEVKILDSVLCHIKRKNRILTSVHKTQCPRHMASQELLELGKLDYYLEYQLSQQINVNGWVRLSYSSLFKGDHSAKKHGKNILIVGEAGTGKSVLCTRITEDWANGKLFQDFFIVFLLPLNQRSVASAKNLTELLLNLYAFDSKTCSNIQMYLTQNQKDNILIIADGWDQLCESESQQGSFLHSLLFGSLLPSSTFTVLVTTTPTSVPQQFKGRCIALQGLSEESTKSYIQMELSESPEILSYITEQLDTNPLVGSMCSVPLNLALICNYCRSCDDLLPSTMPELYSKLAWNLARLKINETEQYGKISNYRDLPDKLQQSWSHMCQLAFENCQAGISQVVHVASTFLSSELEIFGLLKPGTMGRDEVLLSLKFLLPAFRYYLAISHLMTQPQSVQLEMIQRMDHIDPMFWRFYLYRNASCDIISEFVQNVSKMHHSCKNMCLFSYELKNEIINQAIIKSIQYQASRRRNPIMLHSLNAYECAAMVHVLEKMDQQCTVEINFQNCTLKAMQILKLANILNNPSKLIQIKGLDLSDNCLNDTLVVEFFNRAVSALGSLEKLFLRSCGIGIDGLSAVVNSLANSSCKSLTQLDLSFNSFSMTCIECLQQHIAFGNLEELEILILKGSFMEDISMSFLKQFATTLSSKCPSLRRLDLSANKLSGYDNQSVSAMVSQLTGCLGASFDLSLDDNYMTEIENNYLSIMEESIRNKGTIDHTIAHGVFVGPGRSGKDTLMKRLMGEGPPDPKIMSPSTGVLENVVKVEVKKLSTIASSNLYLKWQRMKYDEEALELIMTTAKHHKCTSEIPKTVSVKYIYQKKLKSVQDEKSSLPTRLDKKSKDTKHEADKNDNPESTISDDADSDEKPSKHFTIYSSDIAPVDMFKKAVKLRRMDALREHLESSWSLYLTNMGGQIEFQEHIPLLVCGPSIFFVTFPLHCDLDKPYEVQFQYPDGSLIKYLSPSTLLQEILQILATIYTLDYINVEMGDTEITLKPTVFIIGTHKDCLKSESEKIRQIDQKLQMYVRQTSLFHQHSIQFASDFENMNGNRLVFTVNNLSKDDNDFQKIRFAVQQTVEEKCHKEFTVQCPSSWLIFSLILREKHKLNRVLELKECFKIAQECGISSHEELTAALSFIHFRLGLVRYFNTEGLNSLVVVDPQVLFDKITELIKETFVRKYAHRKEIEEFSEKGIISITAMKRISERCDKHVQLPLTWLTKLLNHYRLAAYFKDQYGEKYFFPSALCHVSHSLELIPHTTLSVVLIAFETGFCPRGMAGALIKCLMTNEMKSNQNWELIPSKISRNQVSFYIEDCGDVTIKVLPTHIEIAIDSPEDNVEIDCSESEIHKEAYKQIFKCMKIVSSLYKKCEYYWTFYCTLAECETHPHPAVIEWNRNTNAPSKLRCKVWKRSGGLPRDYKLWNLQRKGGGPMSNAEVQSRYLGKIADMMVEWEGPIADVLKLTASDVADIKTKYPQRLKLQSREALHTWKQRNGTKATYRKLTRVFERAGYHCYADEIRRIAQFSNSETESDDSSGSGEEQSRPEQPTYPPTKSLEALPQVPPVIPKATETYVIVTDETLPEGERGEVCSGEEVLGSKNVMKTFVPTLSPCNLIDVNSDHDHPDGQHQSKVAISEAEQSSTDLLKDQTMADSTAYDPPHDLRFIPSLELSQDKNELFSENQHILLRIPQENSHRRTASSSNPLVLICREGNTAKLKSELEQMNRDEKQQRLNQKDEDGTTPLHESCYHGDNECTTTLLKNGADVIIWDVRGFAPIHCAAYNGHAETINILLKWEPVDKTRMRRCSVDEKSKYKETALHIACFRGHFEMAQYLIQENEASLLAVDSDENTVLHYATSSNNGKLLKWLLARDELKAMINAKNKFGQTAAHRAAMGHVMSISVLVRSGADFRLEDNAGHTPLNLAKLLSHEECFNIAAGKKPPLELPHTPRSARAPFPSTDSLPVSYLPLLSVSNDLDISASPQPLRRTSSVTRRSRPVNAFISRRGSFQVPSRSDSTSNSAPTAAAGHRRSLSSRSSLIGLGSLQDQVALTGRDSIASIASQRGSMDAFSYTSKETLNVVKKKEKSTSCEEMELKLLFASTYEPPPDLHFIPPLESDTLTQDKNVLFSEHHRIFLRIPREHWETAKDKKVEVRACATMGLNQYPDNYIIVSPICFISCKSQDREVVIRFRLPHAASVQAPEYRNKVCILSTMSTSSSRKNPNTPLFTPTDRKLTPLDVGSLELEFDIGAVIFKLKLLHPALFAVAIIRGPIRVLRSIPIPLRCSLYVLYKVHDGTGSLGQIMVYAYVALKLKTVDTYMQELAMQEQQEVEEHSFTLNCFSVQVSASLRNPVDAWEVTPLDDGLFNYHQVALSSDTPDQSRDTYSHDRPYPLRQRFYIEPKTHSHGAIKCNITVHNSDNTASNQRLASVLVLPYVPPTSKDTTPEPSRAGTPADISLPPSRPSTGPPSPSGNGGLQLRILTPLSSGHETAV